MKKKILTILALIIIISTFIRTVIISYAFISFSNKIVNNEANLIKELLLGVKEKEKLIHLIKKTKYIKELSFIPKDKLPEKSTTYNIHEKSFTKYIHFQNDTYLKITFKSENYLKEVIETLASLIVLAFISLIIIIATVNYFLTPYLEILEKVKKSTRQILKGNFDGFITTSLKGEAQEFVTSYNTFLQKLKESFGVIEEKYTSLIEKEKTDDPLNDAKETIEQLANIFEFKKIIEDDKNIDDIFKRLIKVINDFKINNFALYGVDNTEKRAFLIHTQGDKCCEFEKNYQECRAFRLKEIINSEEFKEVCQRHYCENNYICIPFSTKGNFSGILKINLTENKKEIEKNLPYIKAYLKEISAIIEAKYTLELLHNQSIKDHLTDLFNRRHLDNILPMISATAKRRNEKIGFLLIDMDHFKQVNDTYGHKAGDTVLKTLSEILKKCTRNGDIIIRYGGEEFLVILQNIKNCNEAYLIAEKIRKEIQNTPIDIQGTVLNKTISIGVSVYPNHCKEPKECIKLADEALYKAKKSGRNKIVIYSS